MAEQWLNEIYEEANLLNWLMECVDFCRKNDDMRAYRLWNQLNAGIYSIVEKCAEAEKKLSERIWGAAKKVAGAQKDLVLFGDIIELELVPALKEYIQKLGQIDVEDGKYRIQSTEYGFLSIRNIKTGHCLHGMVNPMREAKITAQNVYRPDKREYVILGAGLGYLAYQIYLVSNGTAKIYVFETDPTIVKYAKHYGILDWIPEENIVVSEDTDILCFLKCAAVTGRQFFISEYAEDERSTADREGMTNLDLSFQTVISLEKDYEINFWRNLTTDWKQMKDFPAEKIKDECIVVAAGPSFDDNLEFIKANVGKKTIIAVGTIFRKLLKNGVRPDFVVIIESHKLVYKQFEGLEDMDVPIVAPMCAYWKIAEKYKGDVYLFPTYESRRSSEYAVKHNMDIWQIGGTVSYSAIDLAVRYGAKTVYLIGLDLAYPGGESHTKGTPQYKTIDVSGMKSVPAVGGGIVYTDEAFAYYISLVEGLFKQHKDKVSFINLSRNGARLKGTTEMHV